MSGMLWLRREARLRWLALVACCLLVAIASATVLTATAGARRGASTVTRLFAVTRPATAEVVPNQPGFNWNRIRALPEVEALTTFPAYTSLPTDVAPANTPNPFVPADTEAMRKIETPVVLTGRLADPASPDEAVVTAAFVRSTGRGVGDTVTAHLTTPAQASASLGAGPDRSGPRDRQVHDRRLQRGHAHPALPQRHRLRERLSARLRAGRVPGRVGPARAGDRPPGGGLGRRAALGHGPWA